MTAGLHHRWRARAADLARSRPGDRALDVCLRHGRPRARAGAPCRRPGRGGRPRLLRARCSSWPARRRPRGAAGALRVGQRARAALRGRRASTPQPSDSACATSSTWSAGSREMARVVRPGGRVVILEITTPERPPLSWFYSIWFDRIVPLLGRVAPATTTPTATCRSSVRSFPARRSGARQWTLRPCGRALDAHRRAGSSRSTSGTVRDGGSDGSPTRCAGRSPAAATPPLLAASRSGSAALRPATASAARARRRHARGRRQAPAATAGLRLRGRPRGRRASVRAAASVELVHMARLVHDDVVDGAALRRGRPTVVARRRAAACDRDRRPPVLARLRPACAERERRRDACAVGRLPRARRAVSCYSARTLRHRRRRSSATCAAASSRRRVCSRPPAGSARCGRPGAADDRGAGRVRPARSAWPSSCSTTCSTFAARPERPASAAARTSSTGP